LATARERGLRPCRHVPAPPPHIVRASSAGAILGDAAQGGSLRRTRARRPWRRRSIETGGLANEGAWRGHPGPGPTPGGAPLKPAARRLTVAGLVLTNLAWAAGYPAAAIALRDIPSAFLTLLRLAVAALLLAPFLRLPAGRRWDARSVGLAAALGILGFSLPIYLQTVGLALSTPAMTAILVSLEPLCTAVIAGLYLRQRLPPLRRLALLIALAGAWVIAGRPRPGHAGYLAGDALLLASTLCFATYNAVSARLTDRIPPMAAAGATLWTGLLGMVPLWWLLGGALPHRITAGPAVAAAYLAVVGTGLAYVVWVAALGGLPAAEVAMYLYLQPVFGVLLSVLLTGARPSAGFYAGAVLILGAVFLGGERGGAARPRGEGAREPS